jgi:hypothetical protein
MKQTLVAVFLFLALSAAHSQTILITGKIADKISGDPLPGATIRSKTHQNLGTTTDVNGNFQITLPNRDSLLITYLGFHELVVNATVAKNNSILYLETITNSLEQIEIKAERIIAEEFTIRKIKKIEIYTNPSAKADPILAVGSTPSATTTDESANISLRGGSPAETGVFLNNVPINDAVRYSQLNGIGTFSIFNTALINNVQVYPGNPPLEFGNSTSGLIALQSEENIPDKATHTVSLTLASMGGYVATKLSEKSSLNIFGNFQPSGLIQSVNAKALSNLKHFSSGDLGVHYYHKLGKTGIFKLFNYSLIESYEFRYNQPSYNGIFDQGKKRNFTVANFRKRFKNTELSFNHGFSLSKAQYHYGILNSDLTLRDVYSSIGVQHFETQYEWKTGFSYERKASTINATFPLYEYAIAPDHPGIDVSNQDHVANPEWFAYYKRYLGARWIAGAGIRKNLPFDDLHHYLSFQGNLNYKPRENWNINISAGRYNKYQLPQSSSPEPTLIQSDQLSLDASYANKTFEMSLSGYAKRTEIEQVNTNVTGVEWFTRYRVSSKLKFQVSFTSLDAVDVNGEKTNPSPYNIHYFIRGNFEYKPEPTWTITTVFLFRQGSYFQPVINATYVDELQVYQPMYSETPTRLPSYKTIDLSISKIFMMSKKINAIAFLSVGNVANFKNIRAYDYAFDYIDKNENLFSQRTMYFGLVLNF